MTIDLEQVRAGQRKMWSTGDWPSIAKTIQPVADGLVERAGVSAGQELLDVGTGSGNVAVPAAGSARGSPGPTSHRSSWTSAASGPRRPGWRSGGWRAMPRRSRSPTSRSTSCCRCSGACSRRSRRGGGRVGPGLPAGRNHRWCAWTPDGLNGRLLKLAASAVPPPPPEMKSPILWGDEAHVRELFEGTDLELSGARDLRLGLAVRQDWVSFTSRTSAPPSRRRPRSSRPGSGRQCGSAWWICSVRTRRPRASGPRPSTCVRWAALVLERAPEHR